MARTRHRPESRVPTTKKDNTSKEAGCGAERLASPNAQGVYYHSLPGPSSQQGGELTIVQLPCIEERLEEEIQTSHHIDNMVLEGDNGNLFQIPSTFENGYRCFPLLRKLTGRVGRSTKSSVTCASIAGSKSGKIVSATASRLRRTQ